MTMRKRKKYVPPDIEAVRFYLSSMIDLFEITPSAPAPISDYVRFIIADARRDMWHADAEDALRKTEFHLGRVFHALEVERCERNEIKWSDWVAADRPRLPKP